MIEPADGVKITVLPAAGAIAGDEDLVIVQAGETRKVDLAHLLGPAGYLTPGRGGTGADNSVYWYGPTLVPIANIATYTSALLYWFRVGQVVQVFGQITVKPTALSLHTQLDIPLPVFADITDSSWLAGSAISPTAGNVFAVYGDPVNNRARLHCVAKDLADAQYQVQFSYRVQ